jgi:hypothetical protein
VRQPLYLACLLALCLSPDVSADGETIDDLEGLSIEAETTAHLVFRIPPNSTYHTTQRRNEFNFYISFNGKIFEYHKHQEGAVQLNVVALDRATELPDFPGRKLLYTWSMIDGHLSRIRQYIGGVGIVTYTIDPAKLSCTVAGHLETTPNSDNVRDYDITNSFLIEIRERKIDAYRCSVRRGNIFATDR